MSKTEVDKNTDEEIISRIDLENGCPLCAMVTDFEFNFLAKLQYKVATELNTRKEIAKEGGFCDFHFRQFKKIAGGKTNISLLKTIIEERNYKNNEYRIECRICDSVNIYEKECVEIFIGILLEKENRKIYETTNGICFVHLKLVNEVINNENLKLWLNDIYKQQIEKMQSDFEEMSSHNSFYEIDREKRKLINVLIEKLAGRKTRGL